jgi:uncharacterized protein
LEVAFGSPETSRSRSEWLGFVGVLGALALFFAWVATIQLRRYPIGIAPAVAIYVSLLLLVSLYLAPGFAVVRLWLSLRLHGASGALTCVAIFLLPYLIYSAGTGDFRWWACARLFALAAIPFGVFAVAPVSNPRRLNWQDALVLLWILLPVLFGRIAGIWSVPVNLDFMTRVFLVAAGAWSFLIIRGLDQAGYDLLFSRAILGDALVAWAALAVIAVPLGFALHFIAWNPHWRGLPAFAIDYVTIFVFVAMGEELFFRGVLQNLLEGSLQSRGAAHASASVLFGLSHIRHAPFPNWRYVILATTAGWFYGWAYQKHRSLIASATTHALVDTIWRIWFTVARV